MNELTLSANTSYDMSDSRKAAPLPILTSEIVQATLRALQSSLSVNKDRDRAISPAAAELAKDLVSISSQSSPRDDSSVDSRECNEAMIEADDAAPTCNGISDVQESDSEADDDSDWSSSSSSEAYLAPEVVHTVFGAAALALDLASCVAPPSPDADARQTNSPISPGLQGSTTDSRVTPMPTAERKASICWSPEFSAALHPPDIPSIRLTVQPNISSPNEPDTPPITEEEAELRAAKMVQTLL